MKLESSGSKHHIPAHDHSTIRVSDCDYHFESIISEADVEFKSERKYTYVSLAECLSREKAQESSQQAEKEQTQSTVVDNDSITSMQSTDEHAIISSNLPHEFGMFNNDTVVFMDKEAAKIELPRMIVCFQKNTSQDIKDICIDEGKQFDKGWENVNLDHMVCLSSCSAGDNGHHNITKEVSSFNDSKTSDLFGPSIFDVEDKTSVHSSKDCNKEREKVEKTVDNSLNDKYFLKKVLPKEESDLVESSDDPNFISSNSQQYFVARDSTQSQTFDGSGKHRFLCEDESREEKSTLLEDSSILEMSKCPASIDVPFNGKDGSGNADTSGTSNPVESIPKRVTDVTTELPHLEHVKSESTLSDEHTDGSASSAQFLLHHGHDSSLYGAYSVSGRLTHTGHVPYSGSISLRSDSSTTSTRSFAFPILNSEWNSSPVKMAKADRRNYRKHQGWRSHLLCCRF